MISVVTSFSPQGYDLYGRRFIETFLRFWPQHVPLLVYYEGAENCPAKCEGVDLLETEPCRSFLARHGDNEFVKGRKQYPGRFWKHALRDYNFRFDAYKFARKIFAISHAARRAQGKLFWIDADVVTRNRVPATLMDVLLPDDIALCYLPRPGYHSECGFVGYNLEVKPTRALIAAFEKLYAWDEFLGFDEWHDSYLFDRMVERFRPTTKLIAHNDRRQPFDAAPLLIPYMTHLKGPRKEGGE